MSLMEGYGTKSKSAYQLLRAQKSPDAHTYTHIAASLSEAYTHYHRMHKVLVGPAGSSELLWVHKSLKDSELPILLEAAGSAAAEAALAGTHWTHAFRTETLRSAVTCWERALTIQLALDDDGERAYLIESGRAFRFALDIAHSPLVQAVIDGNVTKKIKRDVVAESLRIAQAAQVRLHLAQLEGDTNTVNDLSGFGYEANSLILLNLLTDSRAVALPSTARGGSGHNYPAQTHDISLVMQHWGEIRKVLPIEIKSHAGANDRSRYDALLIRGKMHLSVTGKYLSRDTLESLTRIFEQCPTKNDLAVFETISNNVVELLKRYKRGSATGKTATARTATKFHDDKHVKHMYSAA